MFLAVPSLTASSLHNSLSTEVPHTGRLPWCWIWHPRKISASLPTPWWPHQPQARVNPPDGSVATGEFGSVRKTHVLWWRTDCLRKVIPEGEWEQALKSRRTEWWWIRGWAITLLFNARTWGDHHKYKKILLYTVEVMLSCHRSLLSAAAGVYKGLRSFWINSEEKKDLLLPSHQLSSGGPWALVGSGYIGDVSQHVFSALALPLAYFFLSAEDWKTLVPFGSTPGSLSSAQGSLPLPCWQHNSHSPTHSLVLPCTSLLPSLLSLAAVMFSTACSPPQHRDAKQRGWRYTRCPPASPSAPRTLAMIFSFTPLPGICQTLVVKGEGSCSLFKCCESERRLYKIRVGPAPSFF